MGILMDFLLLSKSYSLFALSIILFSLSNTYFIRFCFYLLSEENVQATVELESTLCGSLQ